MAWAGTQVAALPDVHQLSLPIEICCLGNPLIAQRGSLLVHCPHCLWGYHLPFGRMHVDLGANDTARQP